MKLLSFAIFFAVLLIDFDSTGSLKAQAAPNGIPAAVKPRHLSSKQVSAELLSCKSSDVRIQRICKTALETLNSELERAGIKIDSNGVLFSYNDPKDEGVPTGHSCSLTAEIKHKSARALFRSTTTLNLKGSSLSQPVAVRLRVPVVVDAKVDVEQRFGFRFFGRCRRYARDSYDLKAGLSTHADIVLGLALNPVLIQLPSGVVSLTIKPVLAIMFQLENTDLRFRISGVSLLTAVWTKIVGFLTLHQTIIKAVKSVFRGDSAKEIFTQLGISIAWDFGAPLILGVGALPSSIEEKIWSLVTNYGEHKIEKKAKGFGKDVEDKLNEDIRRALRVDPDGTRSFLF